eukprot:tig00001333_g8205.t1
MALVVRLGGGRSSVSGIVATVFGSTGFLGRYVVSQLGKIGSQVIIPWRGDENNYRHLKVMGDLGQIVPMEFHLRDEKSIERAIEGSNVVVNCLGRDFETRNFTLDAVNVEGAQRIAKIAKEMGVDRMVHVSCLAAGKDTVSDYAKSKLAGEQAVREAFPEAVVLRPAHMFGTEDLFLNNIATFARSFPKQIVVDNGANKVQPVWVNDVAVAVLNSIASEAAAGRTFELGGPKVYTMRELYDYVIAKTFRDDNTIAVPAKFAMYVGRALGQVQKANLTPLMTEDWVRRQTVDVVADPKAASFADLGVATIHALEPISSEYLKRYRQGGVYRYLTPEEEGTGARIM